MAWSMPSSVLIISLADASARSITKEMTCFGVWTQALSRLLCHATCYWVKIACMVTLMTTTTNMRIFPTEKMVETYPALMERSFPSVITRKACRRWLQTILLKIRINAWECIIGVTLPSALNCLTNHNALFRCEQRNASFVLTLAKHNTSWVSITKILILNSFKKNSIFTKFFVQWSRPRLVEAWLP